MPSENKGFGRSRHISGEDDSDSLQNQ
jgi:hypothetical protein